MEKGKKKDLVGFNALPQEVRQGRRKSSLEIMLSEVIEGTQALQMRTLEHRRNQQMEIQKAESIVSQCDEMASIHSQATEVLMAMKFKKKLTSKQSAMEQEEAARRRALSQAAMAEDLAKLQVMVNKAKQSTGMQTLAALWTDMLRGKI